MEIKKIISSDTKRENRIPPGQTESKSTKWPTLNVEKPSDFNPETWRLTVDGLVKHPFSLTYTQLKEVGLSEVFADFHCV
ncbi:MAG: molybdopterin-dependent oxidoreductase, partial [bacterium]|nr:molybdopterin-dependent oxidoreductase [bacterium]